MGEMVAAIFANNLPYWFNIRKSIIIHRVKVKKQRKKTLFSIYVEKAYNNIQCLFKIYKKQN